MDLIHGILTGVVVGLVIEMLWANIDLTREVRDMLKDCRVEVVK